MSHSKTLTLQDLRSMFRILGDARELKHDKVQQEQVIVDGLCNILGASLGWASGFSGFLPGRTTKIEHFVPGEVQSNKVLGVIQDWSSLHRMDEDPMVSLSCPSRKNADVTCRSKKLTTDQWAKTDIYEAVVDPIDAVDSLVLWFRYPQSDRIRGYAMQRLGRQREFSDKDVELARLFAEELFVLFTENHLEPAGEITALPNRLQSLLPLLLGGKSQKQIARESGLSYQTVRSYTRELYDLLRVDSRQALIAKVLRRG
jgi:uncharacterized protein YerC